MARRTLFALTLAMVCALTFRVDAQVTSSAC